jgi:hypothetical protein
MNEGASNIDGFLKGRLMRRTRDVTLALTLSACGPSRPSPKPPATPTDLARGTPPQERPAVVDAGPDCVHARARCDLTLCSVELHNECAKPLECTLTTAARCGVETNPTEVAAHATASVPTDTALTLEASADCHGEAVVASRVAALVCK